VTTFCISQSGLLENFEIIKDDEYDEAIKDDIGVERARIGLHPASVMIMP
jgi:hypothetical protein